MTRDVPLGFFSNGTMAVFVSLDGAQVRVSLSMAGTQSVDNCPVLAGSIDATVDGVPLTLGFRGGYYAGTDTSDPSHCDVGADFEATPGASGAATSAIAITDGQASFSATVPSLRTPRGWSVGAAQRGMNATFQWSVPSDSDNGATSTTVSWTPDQGTGFAADAMVQGTSAVLAVPADAATGSGSFLVESSYVPAIASCDGIGQCTGALIDPQSPAFRATIAP